MIYITRFLLNYHRHFPNVYSLRIVWLLNGVGRDWIALEVPERAGGAGVYSFTVYTWALYHSLCLFSWLFFYLTRWYSPWRWSALSFSWVISFELTMLYTYIFLLLFIYRLHIHSWETRLCAKDGPNSWRLSPLTMIYLTLCNYLSSSCLSWSTFLDTFLWAYHKWHYDRPVDNLNIFRDLFPTNIYYVFIYPICQ